MVTAAVAMPEATVGIVVMTNDEARACVSRIKAAAEDICALLCDLHEREGWRALGYKTWGECIKHEFQMSRQHAHRLINSHIVQRVLTPVLAERMSPIGDTLSIPESHARELAPLVEQPETLRDAYADALEQSNGQPTAADVHDAVDRKLGRETKPRSGKPSTRRTSDPDISQDVPDEAVFAYSNEPDDLADDRAVDEDINQETYRHGRQRTQRCPVCGDMYAGDDCPCETVTEAEPATPAPAPVAETPAPMVVPAEAVAPAQTSLADIATLAIETLTPGQLAGLTGRLLPHMDQRGVKGVVVHAASLIDRAGPSGSGSTLVDFMDRSVATRPLLALDARTVAEALTPETRGIARQFIREMREWLDHLGIALIDAERAESKREVA